MPIRDKHPPCPDPERYVLVKTREGPFWRLITLLRTGFKKDGHLDVSILHGLDLQKDYPLRKLVRGAFQWQHVKEDHVFRFRIEIPERNGALLKRNKEMKNYRFIIILVHGNPDQKGAMKLKSVKSKDYSFAGTGAVEECLLELPYKPQPGQQWLFCLRAECMEGRKTVSHTKSRALLILDGGRWE